LPVNDVFSSDREVGKIIAAPVPWTKRADISRSPSGAIPAIMLVTPKRMTPVTKTRRAPRMSATRPVSKSSAARTMA
jgi:hypothetical protein